jgi:hypothetical protein
MKKILTVLTILLIVTGVYSQAPDRLSYQAVIRNSLNQLVTTQVGMKISILKGSVSGTTVYSEIQTPTPNENGLVTILIGAGDPVAFAAIDWSAGPYFLKTETALTDPLTTYTMTGTSQLLSVPYALYAKKASDTDFNFIIAGITDITLNKTSNKTISAPLYLYWINGEKENVVLSASDVPTGVTLQFEKSNGTPDFSSRLNIEVTRNAEAGLHTITVTGTAENGRIRTYSFVLNILSTLSAELTIKDATSWSVTNTILDNAQGATVKIFVNQTSFDNNLPDFTETSDENGIAKIYDLPVQNQYFVLVEKNDLSNIKDGYIIEGVYNDASDISSHSTQSGAYIGGLKYLDLNWDGIVNAYDKLWHDEISVVSDETTTYTIVIGK